MASIDYITSIEFSPGAISTLGKHIEDLSVSKPLVVTDEGIVKSGLVDIAADNMAPYTMAGIFDATLSNPDEMSVYQALEIYREHDCDSIIAIGGGSSIDLAKCVSLLVTHKAELMSYAAIRDGVSRISSNKPPVIAIPTTAGTGSEVGRGALITMNDGRKLGFLSPHLIPSLALCDPELTLGLPAQLTAATGMDAITHCIESYLSPKYNPTADSIALDGLKRGLCNIRIAYADGTDIEARTEMMLCSLHGGLTFQKGLGAVHGLSHALGGIRSLRLHHGTLNAILLPFVLRFNESAALEKYAVLREVMEVPSGTHIAEFIKNLNHELGIPSSLREMGVREECLECISEYAYADHSTPTNPRPMTSKHYLTLLQESMG